MNFENSLLIKQLNKLLLNYIFKLVVCVLSKLLFWTNDNLKICQRELIEIVLKLIF